LNPPGGPTATGLFCFLGIAGSRCIGPSDALYENKGASHDAVEQGFHDQNLGADHFLVAVVVMKAASSHYEFSWAAALAAG
jgi:hypothetical protein